MTTEATIPTLLTVKQFCAKHTAFPPGGVRHRLERQRESLENAGAVVHLGKKILIHEEKFFEWITSGEAKKKAAPEINPANEETGETASNKSGEAALNSMLEDYAILEMEGRVYMVNTRNGFKFCNKSELRFNPVDEWLKHKDRRSYTSLTYSDTEHPEKLNLFTGFGVEPDPDHEKCKLFLQHTFEVIAGRNKDHYEYLLDWLAWMIQDISTDKPGVALVLRTRIKGAGASQFAGYLGKIWGTGYFPTGDGQCIIEKYNSQLCGKRLLFMEDVYFVDIGHKGNLYTKITEPNFIVEEKGIPAVMCPNPLWVIMATNSEWAIPAGETARRFFMPTVSEHRAGDFKYFQELSEEMEGEGPGALLHYLRQREFSKNRVRAVPERRSFLSDMIRGKPKTAVAPLDEAKPIVQIEAEKEVAAMSGRRPGRPEGSQSNTLKSQNARMEAAGLTAVGVLVEAMQSGNGIIRVLSAFALLLLPRIRLNTQK